MRDDLAVVQTVDFFPPIVDDPYTFGQIAAANSLSDIYAMGGDPTLSMNLICFPTCLPMDVMAKIMHGGASKVKEVGAIIAGGHTIEDSEPKYGLCVTGFMHPDQVMQNSNCKEGDLLVLTKPLGIGVLTTANKAELASPEAMERAYGLMTTLNKAARDAMVRYRVHACTDVTGFGLMGHLLEMTQGSDVEAHLSVGDIDLIPEALELAKMGLLPEGMYRNRTFAEPWVEVGDTPLHCQDLLFDPQTAGGLLMAVHPGDAQALYRELEGAVPSAQRIGRVEEYRGGKRIFLE